jgi:UDP-N-acetylglucosamine transferase subunit ALG13
MKTIAFYISSHGFGHAARNIPIIHMLLEKDKNLMIIVKTMSNQLEFIKSSLEACSSRIAYYETLSDVGLILKEGSLQVDTQKLEEALENFIASWEQKIAEEKSFLVNNSVDLVVSDITPWVFRSASLVGVKSLFISNFTWVEIYKEYFKSSIYSKYLECYNLADMAFLYPLHGEISGYFKKTREVGLNCRFFSKERVEEIKSHFKKPLVYVSVGRSVDLSTTINVEELPYIFLCTEGIELEGSNVIKIAIHTSNTQDYILASDYVITKAGWGTVAEAVCSKKPMLVIRRDEVAEDRTTLEKLIELNVALPITTKQFNAQDIYRLLLQVHSKRKNFEKLSYIYENNAAEIAMDILDLASSS